MTFSLGEIPAWWTGEGCAGREDRKVVFIRIYVVKIEFAYQVLNINEANREAKREKGFGMMGESEASAGYFLL